MHTMLFKPCVNESAQSDPSGEDCPTAAGYAGKALGKPREDRTSERPRTAHKKTGLRPFVFIRHSDVEREPLYSARERTDSACSASVLPEDQLEQIVVIHLKGTHRCGRRGGEILIVGLGHLDEAADLAVIELVAEPLA